MVIISLKPETNLKTSGQLFNFDLKCNRLGRRRFNVAVSCCPDLNLYFVCSLSELLLDGYRSGLADLDLFVAGFLSESKCSLSLARERNDTCIRYLLRSLLDL